MAFKPINTNSPKWGELIHEAIKNAEGRSRVRTIEPADIHEALTEIENALSIPKKYMKGVKCKVDANAQHFPSAYKYAPESTWFEAEYRSSGWFVTNIYRYKTAAPSERIHVYHTEESKAAVVKRLTYWG